MIQDTHCDISWHIIQDTHSHIIQDTHTSYKTHTLIHTLNLIHNLMQDVEFMGIEVSFMCIHVLFMGMEVEAYRLGRRMELLG